MILPEYSMCDLSQIWGSLRVVTKAGPRAHIWGTLWCKQHGREGCRVRVMSTPRNPEAHARDIRRVVSRCPHEGFSSE